MPASAGSMNLHLRIAFPLGCADSSLLPRSGGWGVGQDNRTFQDGAWVLQYSGESGVRFCAFQSQTFKTDDRGSPSVLAEPPEKRADVATAKNTR